MSNNDMPSKYVPKPPRERVVIPNLTFQNEPVYEFYWTLQLNRKTRFQPVGLSWLPGKTKPVRVALCALKKCKNTVNWDHLAKYNFPQWKRRCVPCRTHDGHVYDSPELWGQRHMVAHRQIYKDGQEVFFMRCQHKNCNEVIGRYIWQHSQRRCRKHRTGNRELFGHIITSDAIWNARDRLLGIKRDGNGDLRYVSKCLNKTCGALRESTVSNFLRNAGHCRACLALGRRLSVNVLGFRALKMRAAKHQIKCSLTQKQFDLLANVKSCFYCAKTITRDSWARCSELKRKPPYFIDRIDNRKGYSWQNSAVCCKSCNRIKNAWHEASHMMALRSFAGWESELLLLVRKMKPDRVRRLAAKHRRNGG